ncbi:MAG TPA: hypothetical protein VFZ58_04925 [Candidatus Saccharimonadales bacterium]
MSAAQKNTTARFLDRQALRDDVVALMTSLREGDLKSSARALLSDPSTIDSKLRDRINAASGGQALDKELLNLAIILDEAHKLAQGILEYAKCHEKFGEWHTKLQRASSTAARLKALEEIGVCFTGQSVYVRGRFSKEYEMDTDLETLKSQLHQLVRTRFTDLTQHAQSEQDVRDLHALINKWISHFQEVTWPENWTKLIAMHVFLSELSLYPFEHASKYDKVPGHLSMMAAQALVDSDIALAAIVIAYCHTEERYKKAVGERFYADLAMMLCRAHPRRLVPTQQDN